MKKDFLSSKNTEYLLLILSFLITLFVATVASRQIKDLQIKSHQLVLPTATKISGRLYFDQPSYLSTTTNSSTLQVILDASGHPMEKVELVLTYPSENLLVEEVKLDPVFCPAGGQQNNDPSIGAITISCLNASNKSQSQVQTIARISYRARVKGVAYFHLDASSTRLITTNQTAVSFIQPTNDFPLTLIAK